MHSLDVSQFVFTMCITLKINTDAICKKANKRLFSLRNLRCFNVHKKASQTLLLSNKTLSVIRWLGNLSISNKNKMSNVVKLCQKPTGTILNDLDYVYQVRSKTILENPVHPLHAEFQVLPSNRRYTGFPVIK